ncbi:MAG TPA: DUF1150 family protein [Acetobacteraceae bacterium]|nr:DUF1150 family protein [Acetobacteraceae bacterium]
MNTERYETEQAAPVGGATDIRHLSESQLARLGLSQIAYVRPVVVDGTPGFAIHAADGTPMAVAPDQATAVAAIMQHEMVPVTVH